MNPNQKWRGNNPLAYAAHIIVQVALDSGRLKKLPCEVCGDIKVHAHHDDYLQPLEVRWLCPKHHRELHTKRDGKIIGGDSRHTYTDRHGDKRRVGDSKPAAWPGRKKYQPAPKRDANIREATEMRLDGKQYQEIANHLGVSKGTVYKWINPKTYV